VIQVVEHLPSKHEALAQTPVLQQLAIAVRVYFWTFDSISLIYLLVFL
jgi:hypothetical protein